ncbi:MAG: cytochrome c peroxidase [Planctomycetota bacterium]
MRLSILVSVTALFCFTAVGEAQDFGPLSTVATPLPGNLSEFVADEAAALALGKALFWDAQVGGDGETACATCHFSGGSDTRDRNQAHPGADGVFTTFAANQQLTSGDFPFRKYSDPDDADSAVERDSTTVGGSQGVHDFDFVGVSLGLNGVAAGEDDCDNTDADGLPIINPIHSVDGVNVRQTTGRNAPSAVNAVHYVDNFWDGRARAEFNGRNPGGQDSDAAVLIANADGGIEACGVSMTKASLASQAVGPPGSDVEMTGAGRRFIDLGKKVCALQPLANQMVAADDSVLGDMAMSGGEGGPGLDTSYVEMIEVAFRNEYWQSMGVFDADGTVVGSGAPQGPEEFSLMELNFSLFWGISVMIYEASLVSDDSPFDRWLAGDEDAISPEAENGLDAFYSGGLKCASCHSGPLLSAATWDQLNEDSGVGEGPVVEVDGQDDSGIADKGYFNIGVRPVAEDGGRGTAGITTWVDALDTGAYTLPDAQIEDINLGDQNMNAGAFKTPHLRNVELTGPYFHNGSQATLRQVVEFYVRGGDFGGDGTNVHKNVNPIGKLRNKDPRQEAVVAFLRSLTDERVRWEMAPFDHPQLDIPNGAIGDSVSVGEGLDGQHPAESSDNMQTLPAVGAGGRAAIGADAVKGFLADDATGNGAGALGGGNSGPISNVVCFESGSNVILSWSTNGPIDSFVIEIDNGGELGLEVITLSGSESSFSDPSFRPGVTGYLITPFSLGSEQKSAGCYIRRGNVPGQIAHFSRGDMNSDGMIDVADAIEGLQAVFMGGTLLCEDAADWNDDGNVDISDSIANLSYLFGSGSVPAAPYPLCGSDPSFDTLGCEQTNICQ